MRVPSTDICPLRAIAAIGTNSGPAVCIEDRCAWFHLEYRQDGDYTSGRCALLRIADALSQIQKSASADGFDKKTPASSGKADEGKQAQHDS